MKGLSMVDPQLKKKIINTISQYEDKCRKLQAEVEVLQTTVDDMSVKPEEQHAHVQTEIRNLFDDFQTDTGNPDFRDRLVMVSEKLAGLEAQYREQQRLLKHCVGKATHLLKQADSQHVFGRQLSKMEHALEEPSNEKLLINQFLRVLKEFILFWDSSFGSDLEEHNTDLDSPLAKVKPSKGFLGQKVNDSLRELMSSLSFPELLDEKSKELISTLNQPFTEKSLIDTMDRMAELVQMAFDLEQNRMKGFIQDVKRQLSDFDNYLQFSSSMNEQAREDSDELESGVGDDIQQAHSELKNCSEVSDLISSVKQSFASIQAKVQKFRDKEQVRMQHYEDKIDILKEQLQLSEQQTEEVRKVLSYREQHMNQDSLTGLPNRAAYDDHILNAWHRWQRGFGELSLAVADIDFFKKINDEFGHLAGDRVLKKVATLFKSSIRAVDFIARYGGEEFVIVLERTGIDDAKKVVEELRKMLKETEFHYRERPVAVTISFGVTSLKEDDDLETLFERADQALYASKKAGRNRVTAV